MAKDHPSIRDAIGDVLEDGAIHGVVAFGLGILATVLLLLVDGAEPSDDRLMETAAWLFYNAQFVELAVEREVGQSGTVDLLAAAADRPYGIVTSTVPIAAYYLVPIGALLAAGYRLVLVSDLELTAPAAAAVGATVAAGYFPSATLGTVVFRRSEPLSTASPELVPAMVVAGVVYPVVCGGLGGLLANELPLPETLRPAL